MAGIVIVSHNAKLTAGVKELAQQMVPTDVPMAIAAGIDDLDNYLLLVLRLTISGNQARAKQCLLWRKNLSRSG